MRSFKITILLFLFLSFLLPAEGIGFDQKRVKAFRTQAGIKIDGMLNEAVWQLEGFGGFIQSDPIDGAPETEGTTVWIAFDDKSLYIGARLDDKNPGKIVRRLGRRDDEVESDWFYFAVDPYYDRRSGYLFAVNPAGSIMDGTLFNDEGKDLTWDGVWESAVHLDAKGWAIEMRIPFHQLRFKKQDMYTWGVNFFRVIKRKNEKSVFSWVPKEESGYVSRFATLTGIKNINPGRFLELLPFVVGKARFAPEEKGNPFRTGEEYLGNTGLDIKAGLQSNLTLNLTVNPDFGQVEVDPAVINISDQETYYQEKRPFFVEGADIFRFGTGGANTRVNLGWRNPSFFYSRRIGRSPQGHIYPDGYADYPEWTTILGAAKLTGKVGNGWNIGFLNAFTEREYVNVETDQKRWGEEVEPFSYYSVLRTQKEFNNGQQGLGLIATSVLRNLRNEGLENRLTRNALSLAFDGWTFLDNDRTWVITGWFGGTRIAGSKQAVTRIQLSSLHYFQRPDIDYVSLDKNATTLSGWAGRVFLNKQKGNIVFNAALGAISPGFNAMDMGYHARGDKINGHIMAGYQTFHPGKIFRNWKLTLSTYQGYDFGGNRTDEYYNFNASVQFLNYWKSTFYLSYDPVRYSHYFTRGGPMALYPWGFTRRLSISSDNRKPFVLTLSGHYRTHPYGSYNWSINATLRWKPVSNFSISIGPGYTWRHSVGQYVACIKDELKLETYGARYVMSDIIQETMPIEIRVNWTFSPKISLQAYLQPFIGVGDFFKFKELVAARTFDFDYYTEGNSSIGLENNVYTVDPDGPGPAAEFFFSNPDFNLKSLRGTIVLRWEYKPGSTFYAVWTQNRADYSYPGDFKVGRDLRSIFNATGENIFLLKFNYRFKL